MTAAVSWLHPGSDAAGRREHVDREVYRDWLVEHTTNPVRWDRLTVYDRFVEHWPDLEAWFAAPLKDRTTDRGSDGRGYRHAGSHVLMPYLVYLSLVRGVGLDHELLLAARSVHRGRSAPTRVVLGSTTSCSGDTCPAWSNSATAGSARAACCCGLWVGWSSIAVILI